VSGGTGRRSSGLVFWQGVERANQLSRLGRQYEVNGVVEPASAVVKGRNEGMYSP